MIIKILIITVIVLVFFFLVVGVHLLKGKGDKSHTCTCGQLKEHEKACCCSEDSNKP